MALAAVAATTFADTASAQWAPRPSLNLYGVTGLIDMPTAEVQPDGQVSFTSSYFDGFLRNTFTFQVLPRLEGTFRYAILDEYSEDLSTLYDRSFDLKFKFMDEGPLNPAMAIGLQDFLGTGVMSAEYIVATKHITPDITVTGGIGWGRLGSANNFENPLTRLSERFRARSTGVETGDVNFGDFFRGETAGVFAGVAWNTPVDGLTVKAELSSDAYDRVLLFRENDEYSSQINLGVEYRPYRGVEIGGYWMYGENFGVRATLTGHPYQPITPPDLDRAPQPVKPRKRDVGAVLAEFGEVRDLTGAAEARRHLDPAVIVELEEVVEGPRWARAQAPDEACDEDAALAIDAAYGMVDGITFVDRYGAPVCSVLLRQAGRDHIIRKSRPLTGHNEAWHGDAETRAKIVEALRKGLAEEGVRVHGVLLEPTRIAIDIENTRYHAMPQAIGRTARILTRILPPSVELFEITPVELGLPTVTITLRRALLEEQAERPDATQRSWFSAGISNPKPRRGPFAADGAAPETPADLYPRWSWSVTPGIPLNLFDPDEPFRFDLRAVASGSFEVAPGLSLNGGVSQRVYGNLDQITRESDSVLPRVRSDVKFYAKEGATAIDRLTADYLFKLDDDVYARASVGYFERMFAGVSGEMLWKPAELNWGLGAELNYAVQRDYDQMLGFRDYDVFSGHASFYWDTGFYGLEAQIDAGRYLAGDWGGTFTLTRRFTNGWEVGAFFTLTDVPFDEFGEGSFDKGIKVTIPLNWSLPFETRSQYSTTIRPLSRDGGARLEIANRLYPIVRDQDAGGLHDDWGSFWR